MQVWRKTNDDQLRTTSPQLHLGLCDMEGHSNSPSVATPTLNCTIKTIPRKASALMHAQMSR